MMLIKFFGKLLIFFMAITSAWAQAPWQMLDEKLNKTHTLSAQFVQETIGGKTNMPRMQGEIILKRPGKFRWEVLSPEKQLIVSDGKVVWIYDEDLAQVLIQPVNERLDETPALLLTGEAKSLNQFFVITQKDKNTYELTPRDQEGMLRKVQLVFKNDAIASMRLWDGLNQQTLIAFENVIVNPNVSADVFQFEPPAGVDIINEIM